jgi:acetoacetyl-CoA synthetase
LLTAAAPTGRRTVRDDGMTDIVPQLQRYQDWLRQERGLEFEGYESLRAWSVTELPEFWRSIWDYCSLESPTAATSIVSGAMPCARWFDGAQANYARRVFAHVDPADAAAQPAIVAEDESGRVREIGWGELRRRSASLALELRRLGVRRGDRVAAYLSNTPEAVIAFLASASIGAIWTMCSPDMGTPAVLDRFRQVAPKVLIAIDGVLYAGKRMDRSAAVAELRRGMPSVVATIVVKTGHGDGEIADAVDFDTAQSRDDAAVYAFEPEWLPFDHPLWILYSSGTTGLPKAIVHGHGGVVITGCVTNMHFDLGPSYAGDTVGERFHWFTATGWVMWNNQVGALLSGTTICLFDGSPNGTRERPDWLSLWRFAARHRVTWFGAGAAFYSACRKAGAALGDAGDLTRLRALGSTGSALPADVQRWGSEHFAAIGRPDIWWCNVSGGTDIVAAFMTGNRVLPPTPGKLQCRTLGAALEAWDEDGNAVIGSVGELVCTKPYPSMPLFFWGDEDGSRYRSSYFSEWPGIWRHGDWFQVDADGSCIIAGRSDATINRHGLRMGTADIYAAVESLAEVADTLVIDLEDSAGDSRLLMFVVPAAGCALDDAMRAAMATAIRGTLSPRFVPDTFVAAPGIPRTLSGKKQEIPIKRLFQGWPVGKVINPDGIANPEVVAWYIARAEDWLRKPGGEAG